MIRDTEILIAFGPRRLGHFLQRVAAVREVGVAVQKTPNVLIGHELGQASRHSEGDLSPALPQFRLDEGKIQRSIDVLLVHAVNEVPAAVQSSLVEPQAAALRKRSEFVNVLGRACRQHQGNPIVPPVRQPHLGPLGEIENLDPGSEPGSRPQARDPKPARSHAGSRRRERCG